MKHVAIIGWYDTYAKGKEESVQFFDTMDECHRFVGGTKAVAEKFPDYRWLYTMVIDEETYFDKSE